MNMKKIMRISGNVLSTLFLVVALAACALVIFTNWSCSKSGEEPFYLGYRPCQTLTGSMEPYMMTNSVFIMKKVDSIEDVAVGDVVTYTTWNDNEEKLYITHRITNITEDGIITTKGDNNRVEDGFPLTMDNIIAKEVAVFNQPFVWFFNTWESSTTGKIMLVAACLAVILLFASLSTLYSHWLSGDEIEESAVKEYTKLCRKLGISPADTFECDIQRLHTLIDVKQDCADSREEVTSISEETDSVQSPVETAENKPPE